MYAIRGLATLVYIFTHKHIFCYNVKEINGVRMIFFFEGRCFNQLDACTQAVMPRQLWRKRKKRRRKKEEKRKGKKKKKKIAWGGGGGGGQTPVLFSFLKKVEFPRHAVYHWATRKAQCLCWELLTIYSSWWRIDHPMTKFNITLYFASRVQSWIIVTWVLVMIIG